jgi:hypothetical protein
MTRPVLKKAGTSKGTIAYETQAHRRPGAHPHRLRTHHQLDELHPPEHAGRPADADWQECHHRYINKVSYINMAWLVGETVGHEPEIRACMFEKGYITRQATR